MYKNFLIKLNIVILSLFLISSFSFADTYRDKYGNKTGSFKNNTFRDKYGNKTGSFKNGIFRDKYGNKTGSYK